MPRSISPLVLALCFTVANAAWAEPRTDENVSERANELFRSAKAAFAAGNLHEAHRLYSSAWELKKSPDIAANLGQTELELGKMRDAAEHFAYALKNLLPSSTDRQRAALEEGLAKAKAEISALRLTVTPDGAEVLVDGRVVGTSPIAELVFVEPGEHIVLARRDGFVTSETRIGAQKGAEQPVELALAAAQVPADSGAAPTPAAPLRDDTPPESERSRNLTPAYVATGVAAVGLGLGIGFLFVANGKADDAAQIRNDLGNDDQACGAGTPFTTQCAELEDAVGGRNTATAVSIAGFATAAISGGLAAYLFLNAPTASAASTKPSVVPAFAFAPGAGSVGLRGRF